LRDFVSSFGNIQASLTLPSLLTKLTALGGINYKKTPCPAGQGVKVSNCQIASLFKVSNP